MPTLDIIVDKRDKDFKAYLSDNEAIWESGKTDVEAIGKLIVSAGKMVGIAVNRGDGFHVRRKKK